MRFFCVALSDVVVVGGVVRVRRGVSIRLPQSLTMDLSQKLKTKGV